MALIDEHSAVPTNAYVTALLKSLPAMKFPAGTTSSPKPTVMSSTAVIIHAVASLSSAVLKDRGRNT